MSLQAQIACWMLAGLGILGLVGIIVWASHKDDQDCQARGGIIHCQTFTGTHGVSILCDCYWPDGRLNLK